jgi:hypothetical protein
MSSFRNRLIVFVVVVVAVAVVSVVAVGRAWNREPEHHAKAPAAPRASLASLVSSPHVILRSTRDDGTYARLMVASIAHPDAARAATKLECDRVDFAAGRGVCLHANHGTFTRYVSPYDAIIFDSAFRPLRTFDIGGLPSRVRMRPDGRVAAYTLFVAGDSYAARTFSTRTYFVDTVTGKRLGQLERFTVRKDAKVFRKIDFNFWGVTFEHRGDGFYATLGTGGKAYLIHGHVGTRTANVVAGVPPFVECPSLSPDGTRIAFKRRIEHQLGPVTWRIAVLDVRTKHVTLLPEKRSIDDQVEWQDNSHILYGVGEPLSAETDVWRVNADGSGKPQRVMSGAWSPSVDSGYTLPAS